MPLCPRCSADIGRETSCPRCGAEAPPADPDIRLVAVHQVQGEVEAQMVKGLLASEGIESMLSGESVRLTHGLTIDGLAVVQIMVREEDADRARELIAHLREGDGHDE